MKTIRELAAEFLCYLTVKQRDDGTDFICMTEQAPSWVFDIMFEAHDDKLPNDWSYTLIKEAVTTMSYDDDPEGEQAFDFGFSTGNSYSRRDMLSWVASHGHRWDLVDDALLGDLDALHKEADSLDEALEYALTQEATDVYTAVWQGLKERQQEYEEEDSV